MAGHFSIFASVVILYGPPRKIGRLALLVVGGGVLLELVQLAVSGCALSGPGLIDSAFDLTVDVMGAVACWGARLITGLAPTLPPDLN